MTSPKILDAMQSQKVEYCIPMWLRDQQITLATKRIAARIEPGYAERPEPIAIVCYGPSLNETWEQIRDFPLVMTCSGAHRFLTERLILPSYHVEVDPRAHKTALIGPPCRETVYLISSTCHQKVFDHLEGYDVRLWHVFDNQEDGKRTLPHGEWALTGGCSVGLRALTIAGFLGFRDLHVFGMDGSEGASGKHAAEHPNQPKDHALTEYPVGSGRMWKTTVSMLEAARGTFHELDQMPEVRATFYGDGLVQAMARDYVPKPSPLGRKFEKVVGYRKEALISEEYRALNAQLHRDNLAYGVGGAKHAPTVLRLAESIGARSVLDYGCGKSQLAKAIPYGINEYDPAVPGKDESPKPADLVCCTDVLEHVEPEKIEHVLRDLRRVTLKVGFFTIHTGPAQKVLADGRNAHVLQRDKAWWAKMLGHYFQVGSILEKGPELYVVVGPKKVKQVA
jgi:uncharacterized Rossmann fold enzyme